MGLFDRINVVNDPAYQAWREAEEHWAEILAIEAKLGPMTRLRLGIHYSGQPVEVVEATVHVPRKVTPQVGQHVYWKQHSGDGQHISWSIDWDRAPQYGAPEYDAQAAGAAAIAQALATGGYATLAQPVDAGDQATMLAAQRADLEQRRSAGQVTDAEYAERARDLDNWESNLKRLG